MTWCGNALQMMCAEIYYVAASYECIYLRREINDHTHKVLSLLADVAYMLFVSTMYFKLYSNSLLHSPDTKIVVKMSVCSN